MIRFEHVTRRYEPGGRPALDDVTVEFNRGDFVFLIGASGSGKSTLLRMILREGLPQQGKVTVAGQNLGLMLERRVPDYRRSIGMVFQDFRLLPDKTVFDNVAFAMRVIGAKRSQIRERVTEVLERVGLEDLARRYPHEISGGEQQRAAIARAIVNEPAIVLADEPTGNLDPRASDEVMKILRWINASGTTVVMATHDRAIVDRMRRRVVQLHDGALVRDDERGTYDPPRGSHAWTILRDQETSGGLRAHDPRAHDEDVSAAAAEVPPPEALTADAARAAGRDVPVAAEEARARTELADGSEEGADAAAPDTADAASAEAPAAPVRVTWPEHLRTEQSGPEVPEPTGDFTGAELPDLARDGFMETEGEGADPERLRDALRQAVTSHTQMSAQPDGAAEQPHTSWLTHASGGAVDRAGSAATPVVPGSARARRDEIEDALLRAQSGDDEPPVHDPGLPDSRGQGPRRRLVAPPSAPVGTTPEEPGPEESGLDEPGPEEPGRDEPGPEEPGPDAPPQDAPAEDAPEAAHISDVAPDPEPAPDPEAAEIVPDVDRPASPIDVDGEEVGDLPSEAQAPPGASEPADAENAEDDAEDGAEAGGDSQEAADPERAEKPQRDVPRPRSSASQSTYTDTRRTAEQLGVSAERRPFWRRLRRNR